MNIALNGKGAAALTFLVALVPALGGDSTALAAQTDIYEPFGACSTGTPALNEPSSELALCLAGAASQGNLRIGRVDISITDFDLQFAATGIGAGDPECPQPELCFGRAPGTTTVVSAPSVIESRLGQPGHGRRDDDRGRRVRLKLTIESAGDVRAVSPGFIFGIPIPLLRLPVKIHVEAPEVGRHCYVGSAQEPILLNAAVAGPPASVDSAQDPNGFATEVLTVAGLPLADQAFSVPTARGCGYFHPQRYDQDGPANRLVNGSLGLPSPTGANELQLPAVSVSFAVAGFDGTPPDGGAELQAAFEAAR